LSHGELAQQDGEFVPRAELLQVALGNVQLEGHVLHEVRWLDLRVHRNIWSKAIDEEGVSLATILFVIVAFVFILLFLGQTNSKLAVEEAHVAEVARSAAWVKLSSSERKPIDRVEG
jgi:hypothetical protein